MGNKYEVRKVRGVTFFFKYEEDAPDLLHIWVRHLTTIEESIEVFFESESKYNKKHNRYEALNQTHKIYWNYIGDIKNKVIIITCFKV